MSSIHTHTRNKKGQTLECPYTQYNDCLILCTQINILNDKSTMERVKINQTQMGLFRGFMGHDTSSTNKHWIPFLCYTLILIIHIKMKLMAFCVAQKKNNRRKKAYNNKTKHVSLEANWQTK